MTRYFVSGITVFERADIIDYAIAYTVNFITTTYELSGEGALIAKLQGLTVVPAADAYPSLE